MAHRPDTHEIEATVLQLLHSVLPGICCISLPNSERKSWAITHPELVAEILQRERSVFCIAVLRRTGEMIENSEVESLDAALGRVAELMRTFSAAPSPPVLERKPARSAPRLRRTA